MSAAPRSKSEELDDGIVLKALRGKDASARRAMSQLYDFYSPSVNYGVGWACRASAYFDDVDDIRQEVWRRLLDRGAKLVGYYDPKRGKLGSFIRTLAYQQALAAIYAQRRQSPAAAKRTLEPEDIKDSKTSQFVAEMIQSDFFRRLMERAREELEELDLLLLREIRLKGRKMAVVAAELGESKGALYKRNERLKDKLALLARDLLDGAPPPDASNDRALAGVLTGIVAALVSMGSIGL